ncbi:MAG: 3-keto-steroid reductase [Vezdaea aestivalis]|nr:MAG: 3-keto-steroid reductase [Vezdaea aestivalis]
MANSTEYVVLVTGANSGIGFATCCRIIDEFLYTRPVSHRIKIIITTRSQAKASSTIQKLQQHTRDWSTKFIRTSPGLFNWRNPFKQQNTNVDTDRVSFQSEILELTDIVSIRDCANRLRFTNTKIDAVILNAGISDIESINWGRATWKSMTDTRHALTWPDYHRISVGLVCPPQTIKAGKETYQPPIAKIFMANTFGHYLLTHGIAPLLTREPGQDPARIIWVSSISTFSQALNPDDIQGMRSGHSYESCKRLADLLVLTSNLPSTSKSVSRFLSHPSTPPSHTQPPTLYLTHPGCVLTEIAGITNPILLAGWWIAFMICRFLGSPWHNISPYIGAAAAVWVAISSGTTLETMETKRGKGKWGSATDRLGDERVVKTEVDGWGFGGRVGPESKSRGLPRRRGTVDLTAEDREAFEELGVRAWREMEELRVMWEDLIGE